MAYDVWAGAGAAYGTAKSGIGIAGVGTFRPDLIMKVQKKSIGYICSKLIPGFTVSNSSGHGGNHSGILAGHCSLNSWRSGPTSRAKLQSFQVRIMQVSKPLTLLSSLP